MYLKSEVVTRAIDPSRTVNMSLLAAARASVVLPLLFASVAVTPPAVAQTAAPSAVAPPASADAKAADAQKSDAKPAKKKVEKSVRLDKHAGPWTVIYHWRPWTDVPETEEFVKATHPDPKSLKYAPLIGKDPDRPKPRDAKGIAALQAELEGDLAHNSARGKAINEVSAPAPAKTAKKAARTKKTAKATPTKSE